MSERNQATARGGDILAIGFGTTVMMWVGGYLARKPATTVPAVGILIFFVLCLLAGGILAGRYTRRGIWGGLWAGCVAALLNLLILGSLLAGDQPNRLVPSALIWLPGSIVFSAMLAAVGAWWGSRRPYLNPEAINWQAGFCLAGVAATFLLLIAGGLVTSHQAGLAVVDWPNSYGYSMFLFPLSRMTGGVYYEHSHRLLGSLVGLTTIVLAVYVSLNDSRRWLRRLAWGAVILVIFQGVLGGLRVTGRFTLSQSLSDVSPNIHLAIAHGVLGQVFFCVMIALAVFSTTGWQTLAPAVRPGAFMDRLICSVLVGLLLVQLVMGAIVRHVSGMLLLHMSLGALAFVLVLHTGARAWGLNLDRPVLQRLGLSAIGAVCVQILLGFTALLGISTTAAAGSPTALDVILTTTHQAMGAVVFALAVMLMLWTYRLCRPHR